jgi:hypothetical protein
VRISAAGWAQTGALHGGAAETTNYPSEVVEAALAHAIESKVEAAYRRGDLFDKRRRLMGGWADFARGYGGRG